MFRTTLLTGAACALLAACGGGQDANAPTPTVATAAPAQRAQALAATRLRATPDSTSNFEVAQVHPLDTTPDGKRLLSVNTANGTLEVFDISGDAVTLSAVIKVGMDPVTVRAASNDEAWVVNVLSDSVSIVDLNTRSVKTTLATDDEPADVVFAGSPRRAYVSCAQARNLMVFNPLAPQEPVARIPILGQQPRALATNADGSKVYLAIFESGNGTTALNGRSSGLEPNVVRDPAGPYGGVNPPPNANNGTTFNPPMNPANPAPPAGLGLIVRRTATGDWVDDNGRSWKRWVSGGANAAWGSRARVTGWDLIDRDVAIVDTASRAVSYQGGMLNIVMAMAVNPANGRVAVVGTEATNEIRYEPVLNGRFLRVRYGDFLPGQANAVRDLNAHLNYSSPRVTQSERDKSLGDPRGIVWNAAGTRAYVTGMGSNNLVLLDAQGQRTGLRPTIEVGQGPTGVVLQESRRRAFVLNRFDATIGIVNLDSETMVATVPLSYDPTPQVVREGRPLLYDTHRTSGLGHIACASCHVDGKTDRLAWDLGNPAGAMTATTDSRGVTVQHHPIKGPLLTQTLVDTMQSYLLHWRGDKPTLGHFASAFQDLQGADQPASAGEMASMKAFLEVLRTPPNPYRNLDNSYPTSLAVPGPRGETLRVGNAAQGAVEFETFCRVCHPGNTGRGNVLLDRPEFSGGQFLLPPRWQNFYRRDGLWFTDATGSTSGFGIIQDGTYDSTHNQTRSDNMMAFMYAFNGSFPYAPPGLDANSVAVDAHAAVGKQAMLSGTGVADARLAQLTTLADSRAIGLVASACVAGERRGYVYLGGGSYQADRAGETLNLAGLTQIAQANGPVTFTAVRTGTERRVGIDEDGDGVPDGAAGLTPQRACTSAANGELLVNGGFEDNSVPAGGWALVPTLRGWTSAAGLEVWRNLSGWSAAEGQSWIELDTTTAADRVSQQVGTVAGEMLELRFAYSARPGTAAASNGFNVVWNGVLLEALAPEGAALSAPAWQTKTYRVRASGNDTLSFVETGTNESLGTLIDHVSLKRAPVQPLVNLARGAAATQVSTSYGGEAARAVDGNTSGNYGDYTVTATANGPQDWWQVDLGTLAAVETIRIHNRTDCCRERLSDYYVLASPTPMTGRSLAALLSDPTVVKQFVTGESPTQLSLSFGTMARYVRVQLTGTNYLSLAEVEVMGTR